MKIQVLHIPGCPHLLSTLELVQSAMQESGIEAHVETVDVITVEMAQRLKFLGSPTVRVDGVDVELEATYRRHDYGLLCRLYAYDGSLFGLPALGDIRQTLEVGHLAELNQLGRCC